MQTVHKATRFTELDIYLFKQGKHYKLYDKLGAHSMCIGNQKGTYFAVWAPNAKSVSLIGHFNKWEPKAMPLTLREDDSGIWEGFFANIFESELYKYHIVSKFNNYTVDKADPFAFASEHPPETASQIYDLQYDWSDEEWLKNVGNHNDLDRPISVYEVHLGSWKKEEDRFLTYRELADELLAYVKEMHFTHVEFLPLLEHPFYGSWGYQPLSFFASTRRFGDPKEFMHLVDTFHQNGIGVILDWVPSHFPADEHGLGYFDGTHLFEHQEKKKRVHPEWNSLMFDYGCKEVQSFLISSAFFCIEKYHADAIRVDAVASMLYLDYAKKEGEWIPNEFGGREHLEAVDFLKNLNSAVHEHFPHVQMIAEESSSWPKVTHPVSEGGLGFAMKWDMGWMHDTLNYLKQDPVHRKHHHDKLTFSRLYAHHENFQLCLSHDEVVHEKGSLLDKMVGDPWQQFANLRLLYGYMYGHSGKKLLFMGQEFGQLQEWNHDEQLDWHLLEDSLHSGVQKWVRDLNHLYATEAALYEWDYVTEGFEWAHCDDSENSVLAFFRKCGSRPEVFLFVCNFTPVVRNGYSIGVFKKGKWQEILNSDALVYGGSGQGNLGNLDTMAEAAHGHADSLSLTLPPLSTIILKSPL